MNKLDLTIEEFKQKIEALKSMMWGPLLIEWIERFYSWRYADMRSLKNVNDDSFCIFHIKNGMVKVPYYIDHGVRNILIDKIVMMSSDDLEKIEKYFEVQKRNQESLEYVLEKQKLRRMFKK